MASKAPLIEPRLIEYLDELFPDKCPDPQMNDREVWMAAGMAHVVRHLKRKLEEQEETILEK